jgi:MATE family multidrug resistance protein
MVHIGLSQAATVRTGRAWGRGDAVNLMRGGVMALVASAAFVGVTILLFLTLPEPLMGLFLDPADPDRPAVIGVGVMLLALAALFQLADAAQVMALGLLRGVQDTRVPMVMAGVSYWLIGAPASAGLGIWLGWGAAGVWLGLVAGLGAAALMLMARFWGQRLWLSQMGLEGDAAASTSGPAPAA